MSTKQRRSDRGREHAASLYRAAGSELRNRRVTLGLPQREIARVIGVSQMEVSRTERAASRPRLDVLCSYAVVVGLALSLRLYPSGSPIRDASQVRLLQRLVEIAPLFHWISELPMPIRGDRRAIDAVGRLGSIIVGCEIISRLLDVQAAVRGALLKQRDADIPCMLLVLPGTAANRAAVIAAGPAIRAAFPLGTRQILKALRRGELPPANGVLFL